MAFTALIFLTADFIGSFTKTMNSESETSPSPSVSSTAMHCLTCLSVSESFSNVYFAGDVCKTDHGAWSQEKAYVTGVQAANQILGREANEGIVALKDDELHVAAGRQASRAFRSLLGERAPSLANFLW